MALVNKAGIVIGKQPLGTAARAPLDDVLDAAACAWTGRRIIAGEAESLPPGQALGTPPSGTSFRYLRLLTVRRQPDRADQSDN
jgi:hypothetical protein